jgi:uncharacterized protein (TIGR03545 family)/uncharacterized protein (TIGR03546 family)
MLDALRKFWIALNSANSTKSLSVAIALGVIVGLTPTMSLHNFVLFFIVLIFSVHLGLFLLATAFLSFIGFLLDPLFHKIGALILTSEGLNGFFTMLYNVPLMKLSAFNNTIVAGSFVFAIVLAPVAYVVAQLLFAKYREIVMLKCSNIPVLGKFFYNESKQSKKQSKFRSSGLVAFGIVTSFVLFITYVLLDPILKYAIVKGVEKTTQKEVAIKSLKSDLFQGSFNIEGFRLISDDQTVAAFDTLYFELKPSLLFDKKVFIEQIIIEGLNFDKQAVALLATTPQDASSKTLAQKMQESLQSGVEGFKDNLKIPSVEEILANENLESLKRVEQIKKDLQSLQDRYASFQKDIDPKSIEKLQAEIEDFQKQMQDIKDPAAILGAKSKFDALQEKITTYQKRYTNIYTDMNKEFRSIQKNIAGIDKIAQQDIQRLKDKYTSADGLFSIVSLFTKGQNSEYLQKIYNAYLKVKPYLQSDAPKTQEEQTAYYRSLGEYIIYKDISPYPRVYIQEGKFDVTYENNALDVLLTNYSTNQHKTQKPMLLIATGKNENFDKLEAKLLNDSFSSDQKTRVNFYLQNLNNVAFSGDSLELKDALIDVELQSDISLANDTLQTDAFIDLKNVSLSSSSSPAMASALGQIKSFDLSVDSFIAAEGSKLSIDSNSKEKFTRILASSMIQSQTGFDGDLETALFSKLNLPSLRQDQSQIDSILQSLSSEKESFTDMSSVLTQSFSKSQKGGSGVEGLMKSLF